MVTSPEDYAWSGYRGRVDLTSVSLLGDHSVFDTLGTSVLQQAVAYRRFVRGGNRQRK